MPENKRIDSVVVHMYKMGTGDCFVLKFMKGNIVSFKMLIDCGVWSGKKEHIKSFVKTLMEDVENHVDALVVTHEHKDHVYGFEAAEEIFSSDSFKADRIWMGWTEDDSSDEVKRWQEEHGQRERKKRALTIASEQLGKIVGRADFKRQFAGSRYEKNLMGIRSNFSAVLDEFADLHVDRTSRNGYVGGMKGMDVAKKDIERDQIEFFSPGNIIKGLRGLEGVKLFVLGPPKLIKEVEKERGGEGESFEHNKDIDEDELLLDALNSMDADNPTMSNPFDAEFLSLESQDQRSYNASNAAWRRIDYDWIFSSGHLALRMNSATNNLSLALAFEFEDSGKVMLFPGDAEFGSWMSWHDIEWKQKAHGSDDELTTEDLLNRTVFYKVAHHLSHNGTAERVGLDMMTSPDLVAMATLDYDVISNGWKSTMPNQLIVKELLEKTKGRLIVMNEKGLLYDRKREIELTPKIAEFRQKMTSDERETFDESLDTTEDHFIEYIVRV